jgi:hypothetical protein
MEAAPTAFTIPIERMLATLATTSSESLAKVAVVQRCKSLVSDVAAATIPRPSTRSLMPMVRSSSNEAPVGCSRRDKRKNGPGAPISTAPTAVLSQPILATRCCVTGEAYRARVARYRAGRCKPDGELVQHSAGRGGRLRAIGRKRGLPDAGAGRRCCATCGYTAAEARAWDHAEPSAPGRPVGPGDRVQHLLARARQIHVARGICGYGRHEKV